LVGMLVSEGGAGGEKEGDSGKNGWLVNGVLCPLTGSGGDSNPVPGEGAGDGGTGKNGSCKTLAAIWILDLTPFLPEVAPSNLPEDTASEEPTSTSNSNRRIATLSWSLGLGLGFINLECQRPATSMLLKD